MNDVLSAVNSNVELFNKTLVKELKMANDDFLSEEAAVKKEIREALVKVRSKQADPSAISFKPIEKLTKTVEDFVEKYDWTMTKVRSRVCFG